MPTKDLKFRLLGEDAGASRALGKVSKEASGAHDAFGKLSGQLTGMGGPFGVAQEAIEGVAGGFEHVKEHGKSVGSILTGIGVAATGAGVMLAQFGAKDQQAQAQLRSSVENTGNSWGDFKDKVEESIRSGERFGHTADDTQNALNSLTIALQDPNKALGEMALVTDIAAKKHISLAEASDTLIKAQEGNAKAFKSFGIVLDGNGTKTDQINRALAELSKRLSGQASAAADTFSGKLQGMRAHAEDVLSSMAKYAPILTAIGPVTAGLGVIFTRLSASQEGVALTAGAAAGAEQRLAVAEGEAAAAGGAGGARFGGAARGLGLLGGVAAVGAAAYFAHSVTSGGNAASQADLTGLAASGPAGVARVRAMRAQAAKAFGNDGGFGGAASGLIKQYDNALKAASGSEKLAADNVKALTAEQAKLVPVVDQDVAAMHRLTDRVLAASATSDAFQKSLNDLQGAVSTNSHTLSGNSTAAITNRDALRNLAQQELAHIDALKAQGASSAKVRAEALRMSGALETQATKVLGNKVAVDKLLHSFHLLPKDITTEMHLDPKDKLAARVAAIKRLLGTIPTDAVINMELAATGHTGRRVGLASGGEVRGGIPGRDSVPALLMPGEFVVDAQGKNLHVSGGGRTVHVHNNFYTPTDPVAVGRATDKALREFYETTGTKPISA